MNVAAVNAAQGNSQSKRWVFTYNNPSLIADELPKDQTIYAYWIYQKERGQEGTEHYQGYLRFNSRKRFTQVVNYLHALGWDGVHVEKAKGNEKQCHDYCSKEDTRIDGPWEFGTYDANEGKQGHRSDLEDIAQAIRTGAQLRDIADTHPGDYIRYHGGIQALHLQLAPAPPIQRDVSVIVLWGPTGTGKTHRFMHGYPEIYSVKPGRDPWGQYRGQKAILFDEFNPEKWTLQEMNGFLDTWRLSLDARYHDRFAEWTLVGICANSPPTSWYPNAPPMLWDAFKRRITNRCWEVTNREPTLDQILATQPSPPN